MNKILIIGILCTICCVCGLVFTTRTGVYWLSLYTEVFINPCLTVLALCEVLIIVFIYGYKQYVPTELSNSLYYDNILAPNI